MKRKIPSLVTILVLTTLTSVMWITLSIYRAITTEPAAVVPEEISRALDPELDQGTISEIQKRIFLGEDQIPATIITSPAPTSIPEESPTPTPVSEEETQ